jgi:hypothetical protein
MKVAKGFATDLCNRVLQETAAVLDLPQITEKAVETVS